MFIRTAATFRRILRSAALAAAALSTVGAHAELINFHFGATRAPAAFSGAAAVGAAGDFWNFATGDFATYLSATDLPLKDAGNSATNVMLSYSSGSPAPASGVYGSTGTGCLFDAANPLSDLMCDYLYDWAGSPDASVTLSGLSAGAQYSLILYSSANASQRQTDFMLGGSTQSTTAANTAGLLQSGVNYTEFTGTVDANGAISFSFTGPSEGNLNGFQLTLDDATPRDLPEPASILLAATALALGGMSMRRRNRAPRA